MQFTFKDIVDIKNWQNIQNHFSEVLRINLRTVDKEGNLLTTPSIWAKISDEISKHTPPGITYCHNLFLKALSSDESKWEEGYECPEGFQNFLIPLKIREETAAYLCVGPAIVGKPKDSSVYIETAKKLELNQEIILDALRELKIYSFYGIKSIIELLYDIGVCVCQLSYQNVKLKSLIPGAPGIIERVQEFYVERLLNALLEVSCSFTKANRGSIMLLDKDKNELYIKMAKGLDEKIVAKTHVKLDEGLAGMVVREEKPLFIDDNVKDERIRQYLKNPKLRYSILIPLKGKDSIIGVLNIGTYDDNPQKFTSHSVETIDKLADLVKATISGLS